MTKLCSDVLNALSGKTLVTAESLTGGGIGAALTAVSGASSVYKGGVISYTNQVKEHILSVPGDVLAQHGAVSAPVAEAMAVGVRKLLNADVAVSVTGLAGPGGDAYGNPVGTVYIGYADEKQSLSVHRIFTGTREEVRQQTIAAALKLVLSQNP
ncbi:MAG: CinA family protein [Oscillospiraceae bacterium]|nr:CinA family protein [Oscillospiraceae bacterium]